MNRVFLLSTLAAALVGCYGSKQVTCDPPELHIYWTPGPPPNGGFTVPGLVAAGFPSSLGCTDAGVTGVQLTVGGVLQPCTTAGFCVDINTWRCDTGGLTVPLGSGGNYSVAIDAFDAAGNLKYTSFDNVPVPGCNVSAVGIFTLGVPGTIGLDYAFTPAANCQPASDITWDLRSGFATPFDSGSIACGFTNPFTVNGGAAVPAGVYTLANVAEVAGSPSVSFHAFCSSTPFVHAGPETLIVDMPASTQTCF